MFAFTLYFENRANVMADGLEITYEAKREVKDNAKIFSFFLV